MRALALFPSVLASAACSMLAGTPGQRLDPAKVYLGTSVITVRRGEMDRYACVNGRLWCYSGGSTILFECRCASP